MRLRRAKEDAEAELREQRDRFEKLAVEREMLLREVNHRVGNSLQLHRGLPAIAGRRVEELRRSRPRSPMRRVA